jgi:hypothetical protein
MIYKILIIKSGGVLCYSKSFTSGDELDHNFISGFFTAINDVAQQIGGGEIRSLNFRKFNIIYSYDDEKLCIFLLLTNIYDAEDEVREKIEILKTEFIRQYRKYLINWDCELGRFESFDDFTEKYIFIPPKILLVGEIGVGKTTILNLFPGETIIELDDNMNEIIKKKVKLNFSKRINEIILREVDLQYLVNESHIYINLLASIDVFCIVTNSGASNLTRTKNLFSLIEPKVKKAKFCVIANFQDLKKVSFIPEKVEDLFGITTFGFSAVSKGAENKIYSIIKEILRYINPK